MIAAASVTISVLVKKFIVFALTDAAVVLIDLSCCTSTFSAIIDEGTRADSTDTIDEETIVKLRADCANTSFVVGISTYTTTLASHYLLIDSTRIAVITINTWPRASWADLASTIDTTEATDALAKLIIFVVNFISATLFDTDSELVSVETFTALTTLSVVIISRV